MLHRSRVSRPGARKGVSVEPPLDALGGINTSFPHIGECLEEHVGQIDRGTFLYRNISN